MLIRFSVSNFLSFDEKQELSLEAGKTRRNSDRIFTSRRLRLIKCNALFGANGAGKSNLISAFSFVRQMVLVGFPKGFSNSYYRLNDANRLIPSDFQIEIICNNKRLCYGFSCILNIGIIEKEWLYEITSSGIHKDIYKRDTESASFTEYGYFKSKEAKTKINAYGGDSACDQEQLFLTIMNKNKEKMYTDLPELTLFSNVYAWFRDKLTVSSPGDILKGYLYFRNPNLEEIADILNALGTGIQKLKKREVPAEIVKTKVPEDLYQDIDAELEKEIAKRRRNPNHKISPILARTYKSFYTFEVDKNDKKTINTIEFEHETEGVFFTLQEESDGSARLFDLIEILLKESDNNIYVIDEIDRCLHPAITTKMINIFLKKARLRNTQLIISTHEARLLKEDLLRNDEICFMIKNNSGSTIIKPLDSYQLRADKKVYEALFDGTLDVLPLFNNKTLNQL